MAAGLGFKTFTTGEVLTAADTNGYLMQGVLVFASAAARDAAITSPQEGQCCYLKDTDAVLTYSGAAWVGFDDSNAIQNSIVDAKGDLISATAADTPARLAVGANDLILTADSTQSTGLKYAGNWVTFTPTFTNFSLGNGTLTARYAKTAKTVNYFIRVLFGSTTSITGNVTFTLPIAPNNTEGPVGDVFIDDPGTAGYLGQAVLFGGNPFIAVGDASSTYLRYSIVSTTVPMTWGTGDAFNIRGSYEVA